ncbi:MAG: GGDEF domain-containing protein [Kineosporiaceae bacterium]
MSTQQREARIRSYELVELGQIDPRPNEIDELMASARQNGWADVEFMLQLARFAAALDQAEDAAEHLAGMFAAAEASDNDALLATALAMRAHSPLEDEQEWAAASSDLARAVALLDDGNGDPVDRPMAYTSCGLSYHTRGLWELALEMHDLAAEALAEVPPGYARIATLARRVIILNQLESVVPLACSLAEVGARDEARALAHARPRLAREFLQGMPRLWEDETAALDYLMAAFAGETDDRSSEELMNRLHPLHRPRYRACIHLGRAIRDADQGNGNAAAAHAEIALMHLDHESEAGMRAYILSLTTLAGPPARSWRRYAEAIARQRWQAHLTDMAAARTQIELARVVLENQRLSERAYVDELTGLANRHAYARHLTRLRHERADEQVAAFMIDVDRFKAVNDTYGHPVGDEVLRRVASVLVELTRAGDLAVRMGGDEFLVFLSGTSRMDLPRRGEDLLAGVSNHPWDEVAPGLRITVSAGMATGPSIEADRLVEQADQRLYAAKSAGRGRLIDS